jgi:hypothetical protein
MLAPRWGDPMKKKAWRWSAKYAVIFLPVPLMFLLRNGCRLRSRRSHPKSPSNENPTATKPGTAAYGEVVKDELAVQDARKTSFEQRGLAVVTTAGALATLLFGLAAFAAAGKTQPLSADVKELLDIAVVVFVAAAILALGTNFPLSYNAPKASSISGRLREKPMRNEDAAMRDIAFTRAKALADAKRKNGWKGWMLFGALSLEVAAIGLLTAAIFETIHP